MCSGKCENYMACGDMHAHDKDNAVLPDTAHGCFSVRGRNITLTPRLAAAASFIRKGARIADIGTDHGLLPAYLALNGAASYIIASDVREGPLSAARRTAAEYGVSDMIEFRLTDGLSGMENDGLDTVLFAGMGGETIASVLKADAWSMEPGMSLILQPQSKLPLLFDTLISYGAAVTDACLVRDSGRIYIVFTASKTENIKIIDEAGKYVPQALLDKRDPLLPEYIDRLIARISREIEGMEMASRAVNSETERDALCGLLNMKKETEKWQK